MDNERKFKGVWIPKEIWLCRELTPLEKMYLVEIDSLDDEEYGCFASNKHFENMFGQKGANATRIISNLKEKGWIDISYTYNGKEIEKRIIKIKRPPYPTRYYKNDNTYYKNDNRVLSKLEEGYYKNDKDSITLLDKQLDNIYNYYEGIFGRTLNSIEYEMMTKWLEAKTMEQIKKAIDETAKSNIDNLKYVEKVLYSTKKKNKKGWEDDYWNE